MRESRHALQWSAVGEHSIQTHRQKTKALAIIPLLPETHALLAEIPRRTDFVLTTTSGRPWSAERLGQMASRAAKDAGVNKRLHDLRGTAATYFLSQQLSYAEVALILGWSERDVEKIARKYIHRERFAQAIVERLANKTRPTTVKPR
ncbi:MAG: tyrosine-type recombinase/integrase [Parvularculaceae bacterium]|nr:tyrosine-type recombinase/integrase [Parvularculaceae bacterium]